jgi:hypothetical protein
MLYIFLSIKILLQKYLRRAAGLPNPAVQTRPGINFRICGLIQIDEEGHFMCLFCIGADGDTLDVVVMSCSPLVFSRRIKDPFSGIHLSEFGSHVLWFVPCQCSVLHSHGVALLHFSAHRIPCGLPPASALFRYLAVTSRRPAGFRPVERPVKQEQKIFLILEGSQKSSVIQDTNLVVLGLLLNHVRASQASRIIFCF